MKKLEKIYKLKGSDTAVFLGSGPSINNISDEQWKIISKLDTWTVNNWVYHPFVPRFYHLEVKSYNRVFMKEKLHARKDYENVNFLINEARQHLLDLIRQGQIYLYKMKKINVVNKPIIPKYTPSDDPNLLICNLNSSITMLLELMQRFKYKKVIFFGMDLIDSRYFWTGESKYGKTHCQWNKDHEGRKPKQPHNTAHIKNFVVWFSKNRMREVGGEFFVGHKNTLLYPDLNYLKL